MLNNLDNIDISKNKIDNLSTLKKIDDLNDIDQSNGKNKFYWFIYKENSCRYDSLFYILIYKLINIIKKINYQKMIII